MVIAELRLGPAGVTADNASPFHDTFVGLFDAHFPKLYRFLDRLSGDPDLAADLAQESFVKLYRRGTVPDRPEAWLITVALNLFRNVRTTEHRRQSLLVLAQHETTAADSTRPADDDAIAEATAGRVRRTIARISDRDGQLLVLQSEGYSYRNIALALNLNEASIGTLLVRARRAFRTIYKDVCDAS